MSEFMNSNVEKKPKERKHRAGIFFPLLLITIGVILFLNAIGTIQGDTWQVIIRLWPLLFIIGGLDSIVQQRSVVSSVLSIGIGVIFLAWYWGYLYNWGVDIWDILRLWPVLIIAWGLDIIFSREHILATILGIVVGLLLTAGVFWMLLNPIAPGRFASVENLEQAKGDITEANIYIDSPSGNLSISSGAEPSQLVSGEILLRRNESITPLFTEDDNKGVLRISGHGFRVYAGPDINASWNLKFNDMIPLDFNLEIPVGSQKVDLTDLQTEEFTADLALGRLELILPDDDIFSGNIDLAVGELVILVPEGVNVRVIIDSGVTSVYYPDQYKKAGDVITSPGADKAEDVIVLNVNLPVGSITLKQIP